MNIFSQLSYFLYKSYIVHFIITCLILINEISCISELQLQTTTKKPKCCQDDMIIRSSLYPQGYLKSPPFYEQLNDPKNAEELIECIYTFIGKPGERIQLFYEDLDMYYPYDIYRFNKIDCRYADSICLKFYQSSKDQKSTSNQLVGSANNNNNNNSITNSFSLENHNYDFCNCINVSYTPRQIMSASNYMQVRFKTVIRSYESDGASAHSKKNYRGYLIRYKFTKDFGLNVKEGGELDRKNSKCKIYFYSKNRRSGYFSSPNYPGLYPRDTECHYYFLGRKNERIQISFHTFDIEGIDLCLKKTKSDYIELSNFQNRDRFFSRYCGSHKPGTVTSDGSFFHVTFLSNNIFDGKGFQASYYFVNTTAELKNRKQQKSSALSVIETSQYEATMKEQQLTEKPMNTASIGFDLVNLIPILLLQVYRIILVF